MSVFDRAASHPNPAHDFLTGFVPRKLKDLFKWCEYLMYNSAHVYAALRKFGELVVTDLEYGTSNEALRRNYRRLFEKTLKIKSALLMASLDKHIYGNHFTSIYKPFVRSLKCPSCQQLVAIQHTDYKFELKSLAFTYHCLHCKRDVRGTVVDRKILAASRVHIIRWDPKLMDIDYNPITGQSVYYYNIPQDVKDQVKSGSKHLINSMPMEFLENIRDNKTFRFEKDALFHIKVPSPSGIDQQWGFPPLASTIKLFLYTMTLRKANECVSLDTLIETSTGLVPADDVRVGDLVRTHLGRWRPVEQKWYRDAKDDEIGCRITLSGLRHLSGVFSPHHPILTLRRTSDARRSDTKDKQTSSEILQNPHLYEEVMCPAEQFEKGDYILYPRTIPSEPQQVDVAKYTGFANTENYVYSAMSLPSAQAFEAESAGEHVKGVPGKIARRKLKEGSVPKRLPATRPMTEDFAYILGHYVGNGSCNQRTVMIAMGSKTEEPLREAIRREFGLECGGYNQRGNCSMVTLCDVIVKALIKGMVPGTARVKRVPSEVFHAPDSVKLAFLKGLWEADGHTREGQDTLATSSAGLAYDVYRMLLHVGCIATIREHITPIHALADGRVITPNGPSYHVRVSGASQERLYALWNWEDAEEITIGKSGFFWKDYFAARVSVVEESEEEQYIDFKIAEDSTFCIAGGATKNSIALEHVVPMRILHPAQNGQQDFTQMISLARWQDEMKQNIRRWRRDPLHIMMAPVALGVSNLGGDGRAMLTLGELQEAEKSIMAALGIPQEFLYGGLTKAGMEATLRLIQNQTQGHADDMNDLLQWYSDQMSRYLGWEKIEAKLTPLKMVDDTESKQLLLSMATGQAGPSYVSMTTILERLDIDLDAEREKRLQETLDEARHNQRVQNELRKLQNNLSQQVQLQAQGTPGLNYDQQAVIAQADQIVQQLMGLDVGSRRSQLDSLSKEDAVMHAVVIQRLEDLQNQQGQQAKAQMAQQNQPV
jgi:hypothetical protein